MPLGGPSPSSTAIFLHNYLIGAGPVVEEEEKVTERAITFFQGENDTF